MVCRRGRSLLRRSGLGWHILVAERTVAACGAAAVAAFEVPGGGEDHVGALPVEIFAFLRCWLRRELWTDFALGVNHGREQVALADLR